MSRFGRVGVDPGSRPVRLRPMFTLVFNPLPGRGAAPTGLTEPVLVIDGDCGFCRRSAEWLLRTAGAGWAAVPSFDLDLARLGLTSEDVAKSVLWVEETPAGTRRFAGAKAVAAVLIRRGWWWLGIWAFLPPVSWVLAGGYRLVARFRHRLPGGTPACEMP